MEELEGRVAALESQMQHVRQDAAAARVLAGGADRDVAALTSRMDANVRLLQALRETQVEHGQRLDRIDGRLGGLDNRVGGLEDTVDRGFAETDRNFAEMRRQFSIMGAGMAEIVALLDRRHREVEGPPSAE